MKSDFALDPATSPAVRTEGARVVTAWEVASELASKEQELKAESKILGLPNNLPHSERQATWKGY